MGYGYSKNAGYTTNVSEAKEGIAQNLSLYGYSVDETNPKVYCFTKTDGKKTSEIKYYFDKSGLVEDVDISLYYNDDSFEEEFRYIISTLNDDFDEDELDAFVEQALANISGQEKNYQKLVSKNEKCTLRLGSSEGYVDIH